LFGFAFNTTGFKVSEFDGLATSEVD